MEIRIASPCPMAWEGMRGDERARFCARCKLNVYNLSELTDDEVDDLVLRTEGRLCARFFRRDDGTVLTQDCPVGRFRKIARRAAVVAGMLLLGVVVFVAAGQARGSSLPDWLTSITDWLGITSPRPVALGKPCFGP